LADFIKNKKENKEKPIKKIFIVLYLDIKTKCGIERRINEERNLTFALKNSLPRQ